MPITETIRPRPAASVVLIVFVCCAMLAGAAHSQAVQVVQVKPNVAPEQDELTNAIDEVKRYNWAMVDVIVKEAGPERSIPILKDLFAQSQDVDTKAWIACDLVKLGDKDNTYWNFVVEKAEEAIESDVPSPIAFDADANSERGQVSPEFTAWAKAHNLSTEETSKAASNSVFPIRFGLLFKSGDPRAIPLLRRALLARIYMVEAQAAMGLVWLKDRDSIPLIVEACKRAPAGAAGAIAMSLLEFHDPEAQNAAEPYLPKQMVDALHEKKQ